MDNELTEEALEKMITKLAEHIDATGERISLIPTQMMFKPDKLKALGFTDEEVAELFKRARSV
jgi:DNA-binding ferritin-like protein